MLFPDQTLRAATEPIDVRVHEDHAKKGRSHNENASGPSGSTVQLERLGSVRRFDLHQFLIERAPRVLAGVDGHGAQEPDDGALAVERELLGTALDDVQGIVGFMVGALMSSHPKAEGGDIRNVYKVGQNTTRLLMAAGDLVIGWLLLRGAEVALGKLGDESISASDKAFYEGKVAAARFFARTVLPRIHAERAIAEATDNALMELDEAAF